MALDHQSDALLEAMRATGFRPFREMGVDACRRLTTEQAATADGTSLALQLLVYPVIDRRMDRPSMIENATGFLLERADMEWFWSLYDPDGAAAQDPRALPLSAPDLRDLPPALVITAEHDPLRDEGEEYGDQLRAAGVPVTVTRYPGVFHGFFAMGGLLDAATAAMAEAARALRSAFGLDP